VVGFLTRHLGFPIPSPTLLEKIGHHPVLVGAEMTTGNLPDCPDIQRERVVDCQQCG
jgi:hypothetical protein